MMKCRDCNYYSIVDGTIFCNSRNHKRRTVRISEEEAKYSDGSHRQYYIECPVCKNGVDVSTNYYKD